MITPMNKAELGINADTAKRLSLLPNLFTTADAISVGFPSSSFHRLSRAGAISRVARGFYAKSHEFAADFELAEIATRSRMATICLTSALVEHGLSDFIPNKIDLALPRGEASIRSNVQIKWHWFDTKTFEFERELRPVDGTKLVIGRYTAERTLADLARHPKLDRQELVEAIKRWLRLPGNYPSKLIEVARELPGAERLIVELLEILT